MAVMAHNTPEVVEAHFGVPMAGCILNTINTRLDADREFAGVIASAIKQNNAVLPVIEIADADVEPIASVGGESYEEFLAAAEIAVFDVILPQNEWDTIALPGVE